MIVLGALVGVLIGTELAARVPAAVPRKAFAIFLLVIAVKMFTAPMRKKPLASGSQPASAAADVEQGDLQRDAGDPPAGK